MQIILIITSDRQWYKTGGGHPTKCDHDNFKDRKKKVIVGRSYKN